VSGYTRILNSILTSTIWEADAETTKVWITMLCQVNSRGIVESSIPGLATLSRVSLEKTEAALAAFMAPDPYSRTKDHDGRRIEEVDGGWLLLNYIKHRELLARAAKRERDNDRMRESRHSPPPLTLPSSSLNEDEDEDERQSSRLAIDRQESPSVANDRQLPRVIPCPNCQEPLTIYKNKSTDNHFYSHGRMGGNLGCRTTVDAETYLEAERLKAKREIERPLLRRPELEDFPSE